MVEQTDTLTEVNPPVAFGSPDVGGQMVAADKLYASVGDVVVGILRADEIIVLHLEPVFLPAPGFSEHMKKRQVTFRTIGKMYFVHDEFLLVSV
jgi:hypothetical protein